jgi:hypothetical protein
MVGSKVSYGFFSNSAAVLESADPFLARPKVEVSVQVRNAAAMAVSGGRIYIAGSNGVKVFDRQLMQLTTSLPPPKALKAPIAVQMSPRSSAAWDAQPAATAVSVTADGLVCVRYADQRLVCWKEEVDGSWTMRWQRLGAARAPSAAALSAMQCDRKSLMMLATASEDGQACHCHIRDDWLHTHAMHISLQFTFFLIHSASLHP